MSEPLEPHDTSALDSFGRAVAGLLIGAGMDTPIEHGPDQPDVRPAPVPRPHHDSPLESLGRAIVAPVIDGSARAPARRLNEA